LASGIRIIIITASRVSDIQSNELNSDTERSEVMISKPQVSHRLTLIMKKAS